MGEIIKYYVYIGTSLYPRTPVQSRTLGFSILIAIHMTLPLVFIYIVL